MILYYGLFFLVPRLVCNLVFCLYNNYGFSITFSLYTFFYAQVVLVYTP